MILSPEYSQAAMISSINCLDQYLKKRVYKDSYILFTFYCRLVGIKD